MTPSWVVNLWVKEILLVWRVVVFWLCNVWLFIKELFLTSYHKWALNIGAVLRGSASRAHLQRCTLPASALPPVPLCGSKELPTSPRSGRQPFGMCLVAPRSSCGSRFPERPGTALKDHPTPPRRGERCFLDVLHHSGKQLPKPLLE